MSRPTPRAVITGIGPVSVVGTGRTDFATALTTSTKPELRPLAGTDLSVYAITDTLPCPLPPHRRKRIDRTTELALAAAHLAITDAQLERGNDRWAVSFGSALAGFSCGEADHRAFLEKGIGAVPLSFATRLIGASLPGHIAIEFGITGRATANADSCAAGNSALAEALFLIERGEADVVIAGAAEAPLAQLTASALASLRVMSPTSQCAPFSAGRDGFILAEGAAALVVESEAHARSRGATIYAYLAGSGASSEAHHMTTPDPSAEPIARAMAHALRHAEVPPQSIDMVSVHGSATQQNDVNEARALTHIFGSTSPAIHTAKAQLGHSLGAASALEAAAVCLALAGETQLASPPDLDPSLLTLSPSPGSPRAILSNAFGFGGINSVLCFTSSSL